MKQRHGGWWFVITMLAAVVLFGTVTALLLWFDRATSVSESVRTGGLASAAVVALYALWLNDRRRRVEESRHELERRRNEQDRERVADERFARAVELLGHEADQVRVGAVHALAGLARSRSSYAQTVLDVVCSYLRRPFDHPDYVRNRTGARPHWEPADERDADRERQVRLAAQRVLTELLLERRQVDGELPDLDLTGALLGIPEPRDCVWTRPSPCPLSVRPASQRSTLYPSVCVVNSTRRTFLAPETSVLSSSRRSAASRRSRSRVPCGRRVGGSGAWWCRMADMGCRQLLTAGLPPTGNRWRLWDPPTYLFDLEATVAHRPSSVSPRRRSGRGNSEDWQRGVHVLLVKLID